MAAKSVLEIDINADTSALDAIKEQLKELQERAKHFNEIKLGAALRSDQRDDERLANQRDDREKQAKHKEREEERKLWNERKRNAIVLFDFASKTAKTLIGAGAIATVGGGLGVNAISGQAADWRFRSMGAGIGAGAMNSANVQYSSILSNPTGTMSAINTIKNDLTQQWKLGAMGISNAANKDPSQILAEAITKAQKLAKSGAPQQVFDAMGFSSLFNPEDISRLRMEDPDKVQSIIAKAQSGKLDIADKTLERLQDLNKSFDEFKVRMLDLTMNVVAPLAPQLEKLGDGIGRVIEAAGNSELLKEALKTASEYLDRFAKYIGDPQAKKDFEEFVSSVEEMTGGVNETVLQIKALGAAIGAVVDFFPNVGHDIGQALPVPAGHGTADALRNMLGNGGGGSEGGEEKKGFFGRAWDWMTGGDSDDLVTKLRKQQGGRAEDILQVYKDSGIDPRVLLAQANQESGFRSRAGSSAGANGFAQFIPSTAAKYGVDVNDSVSSARGQARMMQDLLKANGGDMRLALAAYNGGQGGADFLRDKASWSLDNPAPFIKGDAANNKKWVVQSAGYQKGIIEMAKKQKPMGNYGEADINRESTPQRNITVKVENATGGNAVVQAQQAGAG